MVGEVILLEVLDEMRLVISETAILCRDDLPDLADDGRGVGAASAGGTMYSIGEEI